MRTTNKKGFLQLLLTTMLAMFVGNIAYSQNFGSSLKNYEILKFGSYSADYEAYCVLPNTNTIFSVGSPRFLRVSDAMTGTERIFQSSIKMSSIGGVAGDYNGKSIAISSMNSIGIAYLIDRTTGETDTLFVFKSSFPWYAAFSPVGVQTLNNGDPTKVYFYGCFDSIVGLSNTPKFLVRYDMVTGTLSKVIPDQDFSVEYVMMFKDMYYFKVTGAKDGRNDIDWFRWNPVTSKFEVVFDRNHGFMGCALVTNGTTCLMYTNTIRQDNPFMSKYDEVTNTFTKMYTNVHNIACFKNEFYLKTEDNIVNVKSETIQTNGFLKYNAEEDMLYGFENLIYDKNGVSFDYMEASKDFLVFTGGQNLKLMAHSGTGIKQTKVSTLVLPNPMPCTYSFQVPTDYVGNVLTITSLNGSVLMERKLQDMQVDLNLPTGMYILQIRNEKTYEFRKIIVR